MKTFRLKRLVSFVLAVMMLVSMFTVGIVSASAAETEIAETGATQRVYFQNNWLWTGVKCYCWDKDNASINNTWPGQAMTKYTGTVNGGNDVYYFDVDTKYDSVIFYGTKNNSTEPDQSPDINNFKTDVVYSMQWDGSNKVYENPIADILPNEAPTQPTTPPTDPTVPSGEKINIYFIDYTDTQWVNGDDADIYIGDVKMTQTVDQTGGHNMWTAEVAAASSYTFKRVSKIDKNTTYNSWTGSSRGSNTVYKATGSGSGSWQAGSTVNPANPKDVTDFWDDLWIAPADHNDVDHAIKVWYDKSAGDFNLFVPSYVDLSQVYVYSDHPGVEIAGVDITSGSIASLTAGEGKTFYLNKSGNTTENKGKLNIYQTEGVASMLMTTKEDLYTGLASAYASNVSDYKDAIETKGSIFLYGEDGALVNDGEGETVLKKIKGRGNSSFEASMRIYGKYAYNFNLDEKVELIEGSTAAKKWCLLANNVDHTMMRNTFIYQLADDLGMTMGPETRLVDAFNNGQYLGAFVITEKVEYGKNTLMAKDSLGNKINNLDDGNVDANSVFTADGEDYLYEFDPDDLDTGIETTMTVGGKTYKYKYYATYDRPEYKAEDGTIVPAASNLPFNSPKDLKTKYNYLLEHELSSRYPAEASWFITDKGQPVVVKYPEFANKEQMEWIISEYAAMEQAVYANDYDKFSTLIDVDSFAKMYLMHELSINLDSCATSYYIHNEYINGKSILFAGPTWDFDWAFGAYAKDLKYIYNGSSVVSSKNMSEPEQMFIKDKAIKTDANSSNGVNWANNYNLQAKMAHNAKFWTECQKIWTNDMVDLLYGYVCNEYDTTTKKYKDSGIIVDQWMPKFKKSMDMNNARWGVYTKNDDWGTKVTSDYTMGSGITSKSNFKVGNTGSSGSASKCYENTVYYLNDWLVRRLNYMSGTGNLYNAALKEEYKIEDVTFTAVQDITDDTQLTVTPSATVTKNGTPVADADITYDIYVNGKKVYNSNFTEASHTITLTAATNEVYVVVGVKDTDKSSQSESQTFTIYVAEYAVENVSFTAVQSADESTVTVTPSAKASIDGVDLEPSKVQYTVYVNGTAVVTNTFETPSVDVTLTDGIVNEIYIKVSPVDSTSVSGTSATQKFSYNVAVETVSVVMYFKSSSATRYVPKVTIGTETTTLTKDTLIGKNASQTQSFYWYTVTVELPKDTATKVTFSNSYSMQAATTLTLSEGASFYFGVDNLNSGSTVVDLTGEEQYVRNFKKSASHMVYNSVADGELATTSINGKMLKMGDSDEDNVFTVLDATNTQMAIAKKTELSETGKALADFNLDGDPSIMDVTLAQTYLTL